jgi:CBS domain-containing protein
MISDAACVTLDTDVVEVARRLAATPTGAVVVVDAAHRPIGIVTRSDIERACEDAEAPPLPRWLVKYKMPVAAIRPAPRPLSDIMTAPAIYVPEVAQLVEFAVLMDRKRLKRLPVVNHDGFIGLVRRADVLRAIQDERPSGEPIPGGVTAQQFRDLAARAEAQELALRVEALRRVEEARNRLIEELAGRRLSDRAWADMLAGARRAASAGLTECALMQFPARLCADGGRAINAPDPRWPQSLRGEPRDIFERWRHDLEPAGFGLAAQIVTFPDGVPGDAALILIWGG